MEIKEFAQNIKQNYPVDKILSILEKFRPIKTLVIGEIIIDEYHFTIPKGRAIKDPILSVDYVHHETYGGGAIAIANHISNFVNDVTLLSLVGDREDRIEFIRECLNPNISTKFFVKKDSPTITKKRYLNQLRNEKLFKVEYINDSPINEKLEREILAFLESQLPDFDLVIVGDFGHGFINQNIINLLEEKSKYLTVNVQCNSANLGFNLATKYNSASYVTMDMKEIQYTTGDRFSDIPTLMMKLKERTNFGKFLVTMGYGGAMYHYNGNIFSSPAFVKRPVDTVGAGDAVFAITSLLAYTKDDMILPFIANCVGGIAVSYIGNKDTITKEKLLSFIQELYDGVE
ncbi:MAG: PfkB family carbohydrate kinase [Nanoarchaeota archaeon]